MSKYNVGDVVYLPTIIEAIDDELSYRVTFGNGEMEWFDEEFLRPTTTNVENAQVSKWFEVEEVTYRGPFITKNEEIVKSNLIDVASIKSITFDEKFYCIHTNNDKFHIITNESYKKLKEILLNE